MAKQITGLGNLFAQIDPYGTTTPQAQDQCPAQGGTVFLPLSQVWPDPSQPRFVLPPDIAEHFEHTRNAGEALDAWAQLGREDAAAAAIYAELKSLADSIAADGLIQPIIVVPAQDDQHRIEDGERRWWAHQLLVQQGRAPREGQAGQVEVIVRRSANGATVIRQLAANLHRQDLSAVETAVGLATMIAEIEGRGQSGTTVPLSPQVRLAALRAVAAQRRKEGIWDEVVKRLGKTRRHWEHYLAILSLSDDAIAFALRYRLTEGALRDVVAEPDPKRQMALLRTVIKRMGEHDNPSTTPSRARGKAAEDVVIAFRRKFVGGLHSLNRAFQALDGGKVNSRALAQELTGDAHFDEIAETARQLLPVLEAVIKIRLARRGK